MPRKYVCEYFNCETTRKSGLRTYRFPINEKSRLEKWIVNTGNPQFSTLPEEKIRCKVICEKHFLREDFVNETKHRLIHRAVPIPYCSSLKYKDSTSNSQEQEISTISRSPSPDLGLEIPRKVSEKPLRTYANLNKTASTLINGTCTSNAQGEQKANEGDTSDKKKLNCEMISKKKSIQNQLTHISRLTNRMREKRRVNTVGHLIHTFPFASSYSKTMVLMQLKKKDTPWTAREKDLALKLYRNSPSGYNSLRLLNIVLPPLATIKEWINS